MTQTCTILLLAICLSASAANSNPDRPAAPLFDGLGDLHHSVSTHLKQAQRYFNQA